MKIAMTIAGSDSSGGAGVQADLKTFAALGVYGTCVVTAVTAQNTQGVYAIHELPPPMVAAQIDAIVQDIEVHAVKTGMLANADIVRTVAAKVREHRLPNLVVDPVMVASSGARLLAEDGVAVLEEELLPLCTVATPNIPEAEALVGRPLRTERDLRRAAQEICRLGAEAVVITGGHRPGREVIDITCIAGATGSLRTARVDTPHTHGVGCTFASAIAAWLAQGAPVSRAIVEAKKYVGEALLHGFPVGKGPGPLHHFYGSWRE